MMIKNSSLLYGGSAHHHQQKLLVQDRVVVMARSYATKVLFLVPAIRMTMTVNRNSPLGFRNVFTHSSHLLSPGRKWKQRKETEEVDEE